MQGGAGSFGYWPLSGRAETTVGPDGCPPLPGQRFAAKSRSCEWLVLPAKRVVPRVPCNRTYRLSSLRGFRPLRDGSLFSFEQTLLCTTFPSMLRIATSPNRRGLGSRIGLTGYARGSLVRRAGESKTRLRNQSSAASSRLPSFLACSTTAGTSISGRIS